MEGKEGGEEMENQVRGLTTQEDQTRELERVFEIIRPELNIEKHADFIFAPSHSKNIHKPRSRTWLETLANGTKVKASIYLDPVRGRTPTTKTRKVYLALHKLTEDKGWNDEERTNFSLYEVSQIVGWKWHGNKTVQEIRNELFTLGAIPITWQYSFIDEQGNKIGMLDMFHFLDHLKILEKKDRATNQLFLALSTFRFHEEIRKNLKANRTKPTNLVALELQGEIASVLYTRLDIVLADKPQYERTTANLFNDLNLVGETEYRYPSGRKRKLQKALTELEGKPISTGILHLTIERTQDNKDWKLVAEKLPFAQAEQLKVHRGELVAPANPPEAIPYLVGELANLIGGLHKNQRFYTLLFQTYSADILYQAQSEWKADGGRTAHKPIAFFVAILHRLVHERGKLWLHRQCPDTCKYRPEAQRTDQPSGAGDRAAIRQEILKSLDQARKGFSPPNP